MQSKYHFNIYTGFLNSIYESGDGTSPKTAYIVIATDEEYAFLDWFGLEFKGQALVISGGYSFDSMKATNPKTKKEYEIYFNIELALDVLRRTFEK